MEEQRAVSATPTAPAEPGVPAVPPGPGVQPPFIAAPTEGRIARRWLGVGVAAAVLAACCGMGTVAVGGLILTAVPALNEQARAAVGDYLDALAAGEWEEAHELRCEADRAAEPLPEFVARVSEAPQVESYELGSFDLLATDGSELELPAEVTYADGTSQQETYPLVQDQDTGRLQVCQHSQ